MTCDTVPAFFQRQPTLPLPVQGWLRGRTDAALADPAGREALVWPMVLGAPRLREAHPGGLPEGLLLELAAGPLAALGHPDPGAAWARALAASPDLAETGAGGWRPHAAWGRFAPLLSLRTGVMLMVLTGLPGGERYPFLAGTGLFNACLYHECHDALEPLWTAAEGPLKRRLQGLILMAGGYHHLQHLHREGMRALWPAALEALAGPATLATPWGDLDLRPALEATRARLAWLGAEAAADGDPAALWDLPRPEWEAL